MAPRVPKKPEPEDTRPAECEAKIEELQEMLESASGVESMCSDQATSLSMLNAMSAQESGDVLDI